MIAYILVGLGGILGSLSRYEVGVCLAKTNTKSFPFPTFIINVVGALLLGYVSTFQNNQSIYLLFGDGFLGAFTTFSTFMYEGFNLFQNNKKINAFTYISLSLLLGMLFFYIGILL